MDASPRVHSPDDSSPGRRPGSVTLQTARDVLFFLLAGLVCFALTTATVRSLRSPDRGLPYQDHFASSDNDEWSAYGGNWKLQSGTMVNESNERGAKLVTGSAYWDDYAVEADVALRSSGDAGLIARVSDAEQGVDAYSGIYVGLRIRDQALVLGVADHDWQEAVAKPLATPIVPNSWYHLNVQLSGCQVNATVSTVDSRQIAALERAFDSCPRRGKIGLRSYDSGGVWKNVRVMKVPRSS